MREAAWTWAAVLAFNFVSRLLFSVVPFGEAVSGALVVAAFVWLPGALDDRHGRDEPDLVAGTPWGRDLLVAFAVMAVVFPAFVWGFFELLAWKDSAPEWLARLLAPLGSRKSFAWRLPASPVDVLGGTVAIAYAEEFFYRGWLTRRFIEGMPPRSRVFGVPFGAAHVWVTVLFAVGHLARLNPGQLTTFFPGLLFAWLAARSGSLGASMIVHAASNLLLFTLVASAGGSR